MKPRCSQETIAVPEPPRKPEEAASFEEACELAEALYLRTAQADARLHRRKMPAPPGYEEGYWPRRAEEAACARRVYLLLRQKALRAAHVATVAHLRAQGLGMYADVLESGEYGELGDW